MTVESNYMIALAMLTDWFKNLAPFYQPMRRNLHALGASYMKMLRIWMGSLHCLQLLWLVEVITLGFVLRHSIENRSNTVQIKLNKKFNWYDKR